MNREEMLNFLKNEARGISVMFGPNCETIVHDMTRPGHPILAIFNGTVTGREVGSTPTRQFYHPIFKCVNGFCSERRSFTRKVFSDSLLSAILILHIKVALFIFPKSIDKEVFSTMPMYFCCFLSMNQPHDP